MFKYKNQTLVFVDYVVFDCVKVLSKFANFGKRLCLLTAHSQLFGIFFQISVYSPIYISKEHAVNVEHG